MRFVRRGRAKKRTVAWVDGFSSMDTTVPQQVRPVVFAVVNAAVANTLGVAVQLTVDADLSMHGGEDAVIQRIRGRLLLAGGLAGAAGGVPTSFPVRVLIVKADVTPAGGAMPSDFTTSAGLGRDNILWTKDVLCTGTTVFGNGTGAATETSSTNGYWFDVDCRAQRKLQQGQHLVLWFQVVNTAAGVGPVSMNVVGSLRMLLKRPR